MLLGASPIPKGGEVVLSADAIGTYRATTGAGNEDALKFTTLGVEGPGFTRVLHVQTSRDLSPAWAAEVRTFIPSTMKRGDVALVHFFARTLESADETGSGMLRVAVQLGSPDFSKSLETNTTVPHKWQEFFLPFEFHRDFAKGEAEISFGFGFKRETVEIGGIEILDYGDKIALADLPKTRLTYAGREPDAAWRKEALARIDRIRKSDFKIEVVDSAGSPVPGATVRVEQTRSEFQFGTAIQLSRLVIDSPENEIYRNKVLELFNAASSEDDLKWGAWDGEWGDAFNRERSIKALHWLKDHGFHTRGHVLVWPSWRNLPPSIVKLHQAGRDAEIPARVIAHIDDITEATRGLLDEWDVLNEPYDNHDLMDLFGRGIMVDWFKEAHKDAPDAVLYLNDYSNHDITADRPHCENFMENARYLLNHGAPLGGLGVQAHISSLPNAPEAVLATLDLYAKFKLPIRFTEFDIDTDDEELQADYTRDFLILAYSHPSVIGVQHWGFWEGAHWRPKSAMFRRDWSEKPSALAYEDLVLHRWRTRLDGTTDASGDLTGRGFHGDYVAVVERGGKKAKQTFALRPEDSQALVKVTLP